METHQTDRNLAIKMLTVAFGENESVKNAIAKDGQPEKRIRALMAYAYDVCKEFGGVVFNEEKNACLLYIKPDLKKTSFKTIGWDLKLIWNAVGILGVKKLLLREQLVKKRHPKEPFIYLWFMGVEVDSQGKGLGSALLSSFIQQAKTSIYLETSNPRNIPFYRKLGFEIYDELNLGYMLMFLRKTKH